MSLASPLVLFALLAFAPFVQDPKPPAASAPTSTEDVNAIVKQLADKTSHLKSFVATYDLQKKGVKGTMRFSYRAPFDAKYEAHVEALDLTICITKHRMRFDVDDPEGPQHADVDYAGFDARCAEFDAEYTALFPNATAPPCGIVSYPIFALAPKITKKATDDSFVEGGLDSAPWLKNPCGWLRPKDWSDATAMGQRLTRELGQGRTISLSRESGFITEITGPNPESRLTLASLKVNETLDDAVFQSPIPKAESKDISEAVRVQLLVKFTRDLRSCVFDLAEEELKDKEADRDAIEKKLIQLFAVLHSQSIQDIATRAIGALNASVDSFLEEARNSWNHSLDDPAQRALLIANAEDWRLHSEQGLAKEADNYADQTKAIDESRENSPWFTLASEADRSAARSVFKVKITDVVLARLDGGLRTIHEGK